MRATLIPILLFFTLHAAAQQPAPLNLLPVPAQIQQNPDKFRVTGKFTMSVKGQSTDTILYRAVNRAYQALNRKTGSIFGQQYVSPGDTLTQASMQVLVNAQALVAPGVNESYTLNVDAAHVSLAAPNTIGALRGLQTLMQLCASDDQGYYFPCVSIMDTPRFQWRGLISTSPGILSLQTRSKGISMRWPP